MRQRIFVMILAGGLVILGVVLALSRVQVARLAARDAKYRVLCSLVEIGVRQDATDLASPATSERAILRFLEPVAHHSYEEINLCVDAPVPLDRRRCSTIDAYARCLSEMATVAADAIARNLE